MKIRGSFVFYKVEITKKKKNSKRTRKYSLGHCQCTRADSETNTSGSVVATVTWPAVNFTIWGIVQVCWIKGFATIEARKASFVPYSAFAYLFFRLIHREATPFASSCCKIFLSSKRYTIRTIKQNGNLIKNFFKLIPISQTLIDNLLLYCRFTVCGN